MPTHLIDKAQNLTTSKLRDYVHQYARMEKKLKGTDPVPELLYFYSSFETIQKAASNSSLRVSGGMDAAALKRLPAESGPMYEKFEGKFPVGLYGSDVSPWDETLAQEAQRQGYYGTQYGLKTDLSFFFAFVRDAGWSKVGSLHFKDSRGLSHFSKPGGKKGDFIKVTGVAYGHSLIPSLPFSYHWM